MAIAMGDGSRESHLHIVSLFLLRVSSIASALDNSRTLHIYLTHEGGEHALCRRERHCLQFAGVLGTSHVVHACLSAEAVSGDES